MPAAPRLREDSHAFIVRLVDALRPLADPAAVQAEAARLLGTYLGVNRCTYAEIDGDCAVLPRPLLGRRAAASRSPAAGGVRRPGR